jgi:hypothetical protein
MTHRLTRRHLIVAGGLTALTWPATAFADVEWCFDDPPVLVRLPSGAPVNVNLDIRVPAGYRDQLRAAVTTWTATPGAGQVGTDIQLSVLVPSAAGERFPIRIVAGIVKDAVQVVTLGNAGTPVHFTLHVAAT